MADSAIADFTDGATANATDRIAAARSPFGAGDDRYITPAYIKTYLEGLARTFAANGAVSAPALTGTGTWYSGGTATTTKPFWLIEPAGTTSTGWSTSGTGLGVNAASGFAGRLFDAQLNGSARFRVDADGAYFGTGPFTSYGNTTYSLTQQQGSAAGQAILRQVDSNVHVIIGNTITGSTQRGLYLTQNSSEAFGFLSGNYNNTADTFAYRDAAGIWAFRNGTTAQKFRIYGTYTNDLNYERGALNTGADYIELAAETAGTGDANLDVRLTPAGTGNVRFGTHSAVAAELVTGYITIKDSGGTSRKIAVIS